jgi:hypothetical protein
MCQKLRKTVEKQGHIWKLGFKLSEVQPVISVLVTAVLLKIHVFWDVTCC